MAFCFFYKKRRYTHPTTIVLPNNEAQGQTLTDVVLKGVRMRQVQAAVGGKNKRPTKAALRQSVDQTGGEDVLWLGLAVGQRVPLLASAVFKMLGERKELYRRRQAPQERAKLAPEQLASVRHWGAH